MSTDPSTRTAEARPDDLCNVRVYGEDDFPCCAPRSNHRHHDPLGDETEPAHSIQVGAYEPEGLSCSCGFTPRGEGSHALTNHLTRAATAEMSARVAVLEGQLAAVREALDYSTDENGRLTMSIQECGSDIHRGVFDAAEEEEASDEV